MAVTPLIPDSPASNRYHASIVVLDRILPDEIVATVRAIRADLSVGTSTDGRSIYLERARIVALLDSAGQRYLDACRVLTAARRNLANCTLELETEMAQFRDEAVRAIRAASKSRAAPQRWVVDDWVLTHRKTQVTFLQSAVCDAEAARKEAECLVRACDPASREATLRRLLDETR